MTESSKGTIYAVLAVAMFSTLGTGFKVAVSQLDSYSVVVWMGIFASLALFLYLAAEGRLHTAAAAFASGPLRTPQYSRITLTMACPE